MACSGMDGTGSAVKDRSGVHRLVMERTGEFRIGRAGRG